MQDIPQFTLRDGGQIPGIGMGTFGSDSVSAKQVMKAVEFAIRAGYRHIDCASVYGNEKEIGQVFRKLFDEGVVCREELWITSKVWNNMHGQVLASCKQSLADLQLDYLDLYLVHWPFPNHHKTGVSAESRDRNARPYIHEEYMRVWKEMEKLQNEGYSCYNGTSNMCIAKLELLLRDAKIWPACNEMELHPHFQQPKLFDYVRQHGIVPIGYSPIGSPGRPERDRSSEDTIDIEDSVILDIAQKHQLHPVQICLKWAVQRGQIPIPFSSNPRNISANLRALSMPELSPEEMAALAKIDKDSRLIKGQVFLWRDTLDWTALWDLDGKIQI